MYNMSEAPFKMETIVKSEPEEPENRDEEGGDSDRINSVKQENPQDAELWQQNLIAENFQLKRENVQVKKERYFKRDNVLEKYDFSYRRFTDVFNLPVYAHKDKILDMINCSNVVIIDGFTGSGKTTQVPQFIMDDHIEKKGTQCNIIVTQPRRIAATSVAKRVCFERGWQLGSVVGYQVGMDTKMSKKDTMITFATTGVLLQKIISSRSLTEWTHIIIDEIHERDLETDLLLLIIKRIMSICPLGREGRVKLILMSATLDAKKFSNYFGLDTCHDDFEGDLNNIDGAPVIRIPQSIQRYPVQEVYLDPGLLKYGDININEVCEKIEREKAGILPEMYEIAVEVIFQLDQIEERKSTDLRGSVLVFLPGLWEIKSLLKLLIKRSEDKVDADGVDLNWDIIPLHSTITVDEQIKVFDIAKAGRRKIILSTNIAESSITVPDIVYVIDFCLTKTMMVDQRTNFDSLRLEWASASQCQQRKGRTGRVGPGIVYRLVPRNFYMALDVHSLPEMLTSSLESVVLRVKMLDLGCPKDVLKYAIDRPSAEGIEKAIVNLKEVGALNVLTTRGKDNLVYDAGDGDLTFVGEVMSALPISLQCSRLILLGYAFGMLNECVIIAAGLSIKNPFSMPFQKQVESYIRKLDWAGKSYSDCFALLHVYNQWAAKFVNSNSTEKMKENFWGRASFVQILVMREWQTLVDELNRRLENLNITNESLVANDEQNLDPTTLTNEQQVMIKVAITGAFYPNYFLKQRSSGNYEKQMFKDLQGNDPFCSVFLKGFPPGHNGKLYVKHIQEQLTQMLDVPQIKFDGSKVFAMFDSKSELVGPISKGVYRAIKLRQCQRDKPIQFNVLWKEEEQSYLNVQEAALRELRFLRPPKQVELPGVGMTHVDVIVTHTENPGQFWIVYAHHQTLLQSMNDIINAQLCNLSIRRQDIVPGSFCLAPFHVGNYQRLYYRAKILAVNPIGEVKIHYVDFGNIAWIKAKELQAFSKGHYEADIHNKPCLAVECRLAGIKPAVLHGSVWTEATVKRFSQFVGEFELLRFQIYSVVKGVVSGQLVGIGSDGMVQGNINQDLLSAQYAVEAPETSVSQFNNQARLRFEILMDDVSQIQAHNRDQCAAEIDLTIIEPPRHAKIPALLKGPWSPLELLFQSLCQSSCTKSVTIDGSSVNSVTLDHEPLIPASRMLVSASIGINDRTGRVIARDTTLMPAIPGLLAVMSMLFTPRMELRVDSKQTRYTGALCGLGLDPNSKASVYPEHDMEVVFDTEITVDDILEINLIRSLMNSILSKPESVTSKPTHKYLSSKIMALMRRPRKSIQEEVWPKESYRWGMIDEVFVQTPSGFTLSPEDIFPLHSHIVLHAVQEEDVGWDWAV